VTFERHFVTVWTVVKTDEDIINQRFTVSVVTLWAIFQKVVLKSRGQVKALFPCLALIVADSVS
jgi:hypothetical protein